MYDDHLMGKRAVDFLLVLVEIFSLGVTAEAPMSQSVQNRRFRYRTGASSPEISGRRVAPSTFLLCRKLG